MATYRQIVYLVLDEIKSLNGDSTITGEHVLFLANHYRLFLLQQKKLREQFASKFSQSNQQVVCLDLEQTDAIPGMDFCNDTYLRSIQEIPTLFDTESAKVFPFDYFYAKNIAVVSKDRFKFVGHNKYMQSIIYCTLGQDNHLYLKGANPQFLYMEKVRMAGIFEDAEKAAELTCDDSGNNCDILDQEFPLQGDLVQSMIELIVKELYGAEWRQGDEGNNSKDDLADLISYIRQNSKSSLAKQLEQ